MKLLPILLSLALLLSLTGCGRSDAGANSMTVLYLDVGKADCTILTDGAHTVLIDCAETDDGETILSVLKENRISQIDLLIVTHFDKDHIGGVPEVLSSFSVLHVIEPDYAPENPEAEAYTAYRAALELASITPEAVSDALDVTLGDMQLSILGAGGAAYRLEGSPVCGSASFSDVSSGKYYAQAVAWAAENGIVSGYSASRFGPENAITREQLAAVLYRYAAYKGYDVLEFSSLTGYADNTLVAGYAKTPFAWAVQAGIISGTGAHRLSPSAGATRAQVAAMLMRFCQSYISV